MESPDGFSGVNYKSGTTTGTNPNTAITSMTVTLNGLTGPGAGFGLAESIRVASVDNTNNSLGLAFSLNGQALGAVQTDYVGGYDPGTGALNFPPLLAEANVALNGDVEALGHYLTVTNRSSPAAIRSRGSWRSRHRRDPDRIGRYRAGCADRARRHPARVSAVIGPCGPAPENPDG